MTPSDMMDSRTRRASGGKRHATVALPVNFTSEKSERHCDGDRYP